MGQILHGSADAAVSVVPTNICSQGMDNDDDVALPHL